MQWMTWWRGPAEKHWQPLKWVISSDPAQHSSGSLENGIKIVGSWTRGSHWWQDNTLEVIPIGITCKRNRLAPKTSVGALTGAQSQPLGDRQRISLFKDFTSIQKLLRALAQETSDTQVKGRGNSLIPSYKIDLLMMNIHAYMKYLRKTSYHSQYYPMTPLSAVAYR